MKPAYKEQHGINIIYNPGKAIQFMNNEFITTDKEEIQFLRNHREFNTIIHEAPEPQDTRKAILEMAEGIKEAEIVKEAPLKCSVCGFEAKSKIGLIGHMKKHNG